MKNSIFTIFFLLFTFLISCSSEDSSVSDLPEEVSKPIVDEFPTTPTEEFQVTIYDPVPVSKTNQKPVFVHYMPWFESPEFAEYPETSKGNWGVHWTMSNRNPSQIGADGKREIASHYYPLIGPYDNGESDYLEYAVACMKLSGFDGILIDYPGITEVNDWKLLHDHTNAILPWLEKAGLNFGIVYEDKPLAHALELNIIQDKVVEASRVINYMNENYFSKTNYLNIDGKATLLNFGPQAIFSDHEWNSVFMNIPDINFITLPYTKNQHSLDTSVAGEFAWVSESVNDNFYQYCDQGAICIGGAMPEFNDYYQEGGWGEGYQDYDALDGQLFEQSLARTNNFELDLIQIITWNDYGEGTIVEPTREFGYNRLEQIQSFFGVNHDGNDLSLAVTLYQKRKEHTGKQLENKKLDQVFFYLVSLQLDKAKTLLDDL